MVAPTSAEFKDFVLEVEITSGSGVYTKVCGLTARDIKRKANINSNEVPSDCSDESLPSEIKKGVQSQEVMVGGSGVWAKQSHEMMLDWWYSGQTKNIRLQHVNAAVGDTEYESGPAILAELNNAVEKGQVVNAEISIEFNGLPTRTAKA
ncbi:phage tail tube protein [Rhizobium sp. AAP43]|uniref:phage tail tube protein n=1 Tax=Rhizobium sp. AAP43 TaxID=1523420 RepID=UPI0006B9749A|nr:phage tail tube protein [Rhizobium sp. AAP43]KPF47067.1 hypothetical protein IP76_01840 [Rhizobium sp. AAP43]